ncbi:MAG: hypothetical protein JXR46_09815 [Calditrichaceae bacterium]|nr:hypothetical protein [Calditrichaceae bacterium]MBN2709330.1 hypothetical protein [Calditrichaceae bacterium]RQV94664.1 MAG: hypothetical protein EH224_09595 [Calditrichota bacterium]
MKKVIFAQKIKEAQKNGLKEIVAPAPDYIITPEARSLAKELNIKIISDKKGESSKIDRQNIDEALIRKIVNRIYERLPDAHLRSAEIKKTVLEILNDYIS